MAPMPDRAAFKSSGPPRTALRGERLDRLRFADALNDCIALSALAMDLVESFSSRKELIWIQNHFKPPRKTRRAKS